jgi:hypothetical protein
LCLLGLVNQSRTSTRKYGVSPFISLLFLFIYIGQVLKFSYFSLHYIYYRPVHVNDIEIIQRLRERQKA